MTTLNNTLVFLALPACTTFEANYLEERLSSFQNGTHAMAQVIKGNIRNG